jgi:hypothetical protein
MKALKVIKYLLSAIHVGVQIFFFLSWNQRLGDVSKLASKVDPATLANVNLALSQESFIFISLIALTFVFYITISNLVSDWLLETSIAELKAEVKKGE